MGTLFWLKRNNMDKGKTYTPSEVSQHKSKEDCWFIINGRVLNVSKFLNEHPGGEEALLEYAGKDATKGFDDTGHSKEAHKIMSKLQVGFLQGYGGKKIEDSSEEQLPKLKDMEAYVIKEDPKFKYVVFIEFWVPIFAAVLYFGYRCMTGAVNFQS